MARTLAQKNWPPVILLLKRLREKQKNSEVNIARRQLFVLNPGLVYGTIEPLKTFL